MKRGHLSITENGHGRFIIEAQFANGDIWLTEHEMARLLGVFVSAVGNNLRAVFKSGLLCRDDVTRVHKYEHNGHPCQVELYNMEALLFISCRLTSPEALHFRKWIIKTLVNANKPNQQKTPDFLFVNMAAGNKGMA